jgi:hypothetical protein
MESIVYWKIIGYREKSNNRLRIHKHVLLSGVQRLILVIGRLFRGLAEGFVDTMLRIPVSAPAYWLLLQVVSYKAPHATVAIF